MLPKEGVSMRDVNFDEIIFRKYHKSLCYFAWQLVHDSQVAEDVVQDVFMNYFRKKSDVSEEESSIRSFLYTSVRYACYNLSRRKQIDDKYIASLKGKDGYDSGIELKIIRAEVLSEVYKIIETMPEGCRQVFRKGYLEGLSSKEIAEELDISINTVKTQKRRGMKLIMDKLNPEYLPIFLLLFKH